MLYDVLPGDICLLVEGERRNGSVGTWSDRKGRDPTGDMASFLSVFVS